MRLSAFDMVPFRKRPDGVGEPDPDAAAVDHGFGLTPPGGRGVAGRRDRELLRRSRPCGVRWVCVTAGSPYYNPHMQRPALFPPLDGYLPPEDPLRGVARQIEATARLKARFPTW